MCGLPALATPIGLTDGPSPVAVPEEFGGQGRLPATSPNRHIPAAGLPLASGKLTLWDCLANAFV